MPQNDRACEENKGIQKEEVGKESKRPKEKIDIETESLASKNKLIIELTWPALAENILASLVSMAAMLFQLLVW